MQRATSDQHSTTVTEAVDLIVDDEAQEPEPILVPPLERPSQIDTSGFFDPRDPSQPPNIVLRRLVENGRETFALIKAIGYWDGTIGGVIVPANLARFRTDLTSVPDSSYG